MLNSNKSIMQINELPCRTWKITPEALYVIKLKSKIYVYTYIDESIEKGIKNNNNITTAAMKSTICATFNNGNNNNIISKKGLTNNLINKLQYAFLYVGTYILTTNMLRIF